MASRKPWWKSKTLIVNAAAAALIAAEANLQIIQPLLPVNFYALAAAALPVVNAILRVVTTQGLGGRK